MTTGYTYKYFGYLESKPFREAHWGCEAAIDDQWNNKKHLPLRVNLVSLLLLSIFQQRILMYNGERPKIKQTKIYKKFDLFQTYIKNFGHKHLINASDK